jgi:hypothetical protein
MPPTTTTQPSLQPRPSAASVRRAGARSLLRVRLALAAGLLLAAVGLGVVLSRAPLTVVGSNEIPDHLAVAFIRGPDATCQPGGTLPQGTEAVRVSLSVNTGPSVALKVLSGSALITEGSRGAGWGIDESVTIPVRRVPRTIRGTRICMAIGPSVEGIQVNGARARLANGRAALLLRTEYLRPGPRSWLSLAASIAGRMGLDRAPSGAWVAYLAIVVMIAVAILASRLILVGARSTRRTAWTCALIATLCAACWSVITPPFQAPDEPSHFAYAQLLAETGRLPTSQSTRFSQEEEVVLGDLHQQRVEWHPETPTISSPTLVRQLRDDLALPLTRVGPGGAGVATSEPPGYYALETIPYFLGSGGSLLDSLELMRLLSALMAGVTAMFTFLFVRECLPRVPWAWTVGGLGAALTPLVGFTSGAVTPDAMLFAVSAALFYCFARAFRRGLTRRLAVATGALIATGFLTKVNFVGLAPGVLLGLVVLAFRGVREHPDAATPDARRPRRAFGSMAIAMAIAISPVCAYALYNLLRGDPALGIVSSAIHLTSGRESLPSEISYIWQFYLPRLPGMTSIFPGLSTIRQLWFDRAVGLYGWLDTTFPEWVYNAALIPAGAIALLALRALVASRAALRARLPELAVYLAMSLGLMALIGADSNLHRTVEGAGYAQPRYLMPLLPLAAILLVLAARGAGRRWGQAVGALIVVLLLAHTIFSQLLVVSRFYG